MEIAIRHGNVDVPASLRTSVEHKLGRLVRFLDGMDHAEVRFSEERNPRISDREVCEVTMHGHGLVVRAHAAGTDTFLALDRVVDKLEHRLEKLKGRLVQRSHPRRSPSVHSGEIEVSSEDESDGSPRIVKTNRFAIKPMTPEEAALQMELLGHAFYFFANAETGQPAVVYQRTDGQIGLIDATQ